MCIRDRGNRSTSTSLGACWWPGRWAHDAPTTARTLSVGRTGVRPVGVNKMRPPSRLGSDGGRERALWRPRGAISGLSPLLRLLHRGARAALAVRGGNIAAADRGPGRLTYRSSPWTMSPFPWPWVAATPFRGSLVPYWAHSSPGASVPPPPDGLKRTYVRGRWGAMRRHQGSSKGVRSNRDGRLEGLRSKAGTGAEATPGSRSDE